MAHAWLIISTFACYSNESSFQTEFSVNSNMPIAVPCLCSRKMFVIQGKKADEKAV